LKTVYLSVKNNVVYFGLSFKNLIYPFKSNILTQECL
jgi:hypothetical protein